METAQAWAADIRHIVDFTSVSSLVEAFEALGSLSKGELLPESYQTCTESIPAMEMDIFITWKRHHLLSNKSYLLLFSIIINLNANITEPKGKMVYLLFATQELSLNCP